MLAVKDFMLLVCSSLGETLPWLMLPSTLIAKPRSHWVKLGYPGCLAECAASLFTCCLSSNIKTALPASGVGTAAGGGPEPEFSCASMRVMSVLSGIEHGHTLQAVC